MASNLQLKDSVKIPQDIFKRAVKQYEKEKELQLENVKTEHKSQVEIEEENGIISFHVVWNNYELNQDRQKLRWIFELQHIYGVQLPKMPKEYISRILFDRSHQSLLISKKNRGVIGGICYRMFEEQGFVEIVFCAIIADEQVKGYGSHLMNHLKDYMVQRGIYHLLTYADEYAIGYFRKQDFITDLLLPSKCYKGYIKEYQGATLMGCRLHPRIVYVKSKSLFADIRHLYMCAVREKYSNIGRKLGGIEHLFQKNGERPLSMKEVPGLENVQSCFSDETYDSPMDDLAAICRTVLNKIKNDKNAWPFMKPVSPHQVPDYYDHIHFPVDLNTISENVKQGYYIHERMFLADFKRMFVNCFKFNSPDSLYYFHGYKLNEFFNRLSKQYFPHSKIRTDLPSVKPINTPKKR